jgi:VanZ family protein
LFGRYWLPVLVYVAIIATVSSQPNLRGPVRFENSDKIYHVLEYFGLGFLLARALSVSAPATSSLTLSLIAVSCGILVGTSDEFLQSFIPGRVSSALDLLADTIGVVLAQVFFRFVWRG